MRRASTESFFFLGRLEPVPVGAIDEALCKLVRERRLVHRRSWVLEALLERGPSCGTELVLALVDGRDGVRPFHDCERHFRGGRR